MSGRTTQAMTDGPSERGDLHRLLRDSISTFAARGGLARSRALRGTTPGFDRAVWSELAQSGWLGIIIPEEFGGQGLGFAEMRIIVDELAGALAPEPVVAGVVLPVCVLLKSQNQNLKRHLLTNIATGQSIVSLGIHDHIGGLALTDSLVQAHRTGSEIVLNGVIRHAYPGAGADDFIVAAKANDELGLYRVAATAAGLSLKPELRADGTRSGLLTLRDVRVALDDVVASGDTAIASLQYAVDAATIMSSAELHGVMTRAFDMTLEYMRTRAQFGKPIGSFQALQHRAVDLYIQKQLSAGAVDEAVRILDSHGTEAELSLAASRAKSRCGEAGMLIGRESIKLHGAIGFTDEYDVGLFLRRTLVLNSWLGTPSAHRQRFGKLLRESDVDNDEQNAGAIGPFSDVFLSHEKEDVDWNAFSDQEFRAGIRAYTEKTYPKDMRHLGRRARVQELREVWLDKLVAKGWGAPAWPIEHGGWGLTPAKQLIFLEESERFGVAAIPVFGLTMIGPILMKYGTDEQKHRYLPKIITNEHVWCQGYSEPNAGSDLASLQTEATLDGNEWVINGSKIWTTAAAQATHIFFLARTKKEGKKQEGISFFVMDIKTPGITVRPIPNLSGHAEFCQEFFENVRIPKESLIGELNKGWTIAKTLLGFERLISGSPQNPRAPLNYARHLANANSLWADPQFYATYVKGFLDVEDLSTMYEGFCDIVRTGGMPGPEISAMKIFSGETTQRLAELVIESAGDAGTINEKQSYDGKNLNLLAPFYSMFGATIASGSNDIQRNIIAQRVLNLPMA